MVEGGVKVLSNCHQNWRTKHAFSAKSMHLKYHKEYFMINTVLKTHKQGI